MNSNDLADRVPSADVTDSPASCEVTVRAFEESDRPALREISVAARNGAFVWVPKAHHRPEDFDRVTEGERILVALIDRQAVGFASIWEPDSFLHSLFVAPEFQRRGVGKTLLAACAPYFSATPTLKCLRANVGAVAFYQAQGWLVTDEGDSPEGRFLLMEHRPLSSAR